MSMEGKYCVKQKNPYATTLSCICLHSYVEIRLKIKQELTRKDNLNMIEGVLDQKEELNQGMEKGE